MKILFFSLTSCILFMTAQQLSGNQPAVAQIHPKPHQKSKESFLSFTGRVLKNKVRMRIQPSLDGPILKELNAQDLVVVVGENEDFYAVEAPKDIKGYIYRTYVLDGIVEGNHVNVRLEPDTTSTVIGQLSAGEKIEGTVCIADKRWMEIQLPAATCFYIAKDYIEKVGDANYFASIQKQKQEIQAILDHAIAQGEIELKKGISEVQLEKISNSLNQVISQALEFPQEAARAKEMLATFQTAYFNKKLTEAKIESASQVATKKLDLQPLNSMEKTVPLPNSKMAIWLPTEQKKYEAWAAQNSHASMHAFYQAQEQDALTLKGIIEPYHRAVQNKPGDYLLVSPTQNLPIAYLYSTQVNLQDLVGQEVSLQASPRDNHHFAYPAYFVLAAN